MVEISVIVVSYNVKPFLEQALHSVSKALRGISSEVFVVDNGSGDGSGLLVRERFPGVHLIQNEENVGFARANNQALRRTKGKAVCLVNPDTLVREDTFRVCLDYLDSHPDVGAVGCKILNPGGTLQLSCRRSFPTPWVAFTKVAGLSALFPKSRLFGRYNVTYLDPDETAEVEALSGSFMMVRKQVVDEVGLLDEIFFLYGEDLDWCYRIRQKGWKIVYTPKTQIIHYKGQSTREAPFDILRVFYRAMHLFVKKHFRKGWFFLPQWILMLGIWIRGGFSFLSRWVCRLAAPLVDVGFLQLGLVLAILLRFGHLGHWVSYRSVDAIYTVIWIGCLFGMGLYKKGAYSSSKALGGVVLGLVLNTSFTFFFPQYAFSRQVVLVAGALDGMFLSGWRLMIRLASRVRRIPFLGTVGRTLVRKRALIVGTDLSGQQILKRLRSRVDAGYEVVGFLGLEEGDLLSSTDGKVPVLGTLKDLERVVLSHKIREIVFSPEAVSYERILSVVAAGKDLHLDFKMVPRNLDVVIGRTSIETLEDIPLVDLDYKIFSGPNLFFKRTMDLIVTVLLLPFLVVLFFYLALRPSFRFRRVLISDGTGKSISVNELRKNGKKMTGWLGYVPLYGEVLRGRMSLVGTEMVPYRSSSCGRGFKPGLTGLVQVNIGRDLKTEEKDRYNLYYLRNYSLLLDLEIILRTLFHS